MFFWETSKITNWKPHNFVGIKWEKICKFLTPVPSWIHGSCFLWISIFWGQTLYRRSVEKKVTKTLQQSTWGQGNGWYPDNELPLIYCPASWNNDSPPYSGFYNDLWSLLLSNIPKRVENEEGSRLSTMSTENIMLLWRYIVEKIFFIQSDTHRGWQVDWK